MHRSVNISTLRWLYTLARKYAFGHREKGGDEKIYRRIYRESGSKSEGKKKGGGGWGGGGVQANF